MCKRTATDDKFRAVAVFVADLASVVASLAVGNDSAQTAELCGNCSILILI